jgi:hypothetical protein
MAGDPQHLRVADIQQSCRVARRVWLQRVSVSCQTFVPKPLDAVCHRRLPPGKTDAHKGSTGPELGNLFEHGILCWHMLEPGERRTLTRHSSPCFGGTGSSTGPGALVFLFV